MRRLSPTSKRHGRWAMTATAVATAVVPAVIAAGGTASAAAPTASKASSSATADPSTASLVQRLDGVPADKRPTVVLVDGAWADTSSWNGEVQVLAAAGYRVRAIGNPVEDLTTDAETVHDFLAAISGPIVLVGHSYGGAVITNAATGIPNVKALVYVDAAAPAPGETNGSLSGATSILSTDTPAQLFTDVPYANAPAGATDLYLNAEAQELWASQRGASTAAFDTPSKTAAWQTVPSWYFISSNDQIITASSELAMAKRAHSHITVFPGGSHLTLISHPDAVTATIASAIRSVS
jgi:pimeloyl-ACP methyl ester carboxylesterase